jgi:hypothetical protein
VRLRCGDPFEDKDIMQTIAETAEIVEEAIL